MLLCQDTPYTDEPTIHRYSERYRSCLSANLSAGPASQVVDFNNVVYPQDCVAQQVTTNKCVSSAMSEVNKYGCEVKVKDILKSVNFSDMREAYCRASVTAHDCILSVVKYCSVTEGPQIIDNLSTFSRVRSECLSHLPVTTTTTVEKSDIGGIGDLFPTSDFAISDNGTGTSNNTPPLQAGAAAVSGLVLLLFLNF
ncbi:uncharacterized protein LOC125661830 [Ostrea edulis]|uniref:uncharacterized protein LOC125661830 n=1 Tax=Ostrea edulis TaxID=37623 RepID=UPI0020954006|nr:uncharacterized protein LOC125661830 [Ostrea edulis]